MYGLGFILSVFVAFWQEKVQLWREILLSNCQSSTALVWEMYELQVSYWSCSLQCECIVRLSCKGNHIFCTSVDSDEERSKDFHPNKIFMCVKLRTTQPNTPFIANGVLWLWDACIQKCPLKLVCSLIWCDYEKLCWHAVDNTSI